MIYICWNILGQIKQSDTHKKTIIIVANISWNIFNFRLNVLSILMKNDYRIYVVSKVDQYIKYIEDYPSVTHIPLHELDRKSSNPVKDIKLTMEFMKIYKKIRPDIILHYTYLQYLIFSISFSIHVRYGIAK